MLAWIAERCEGTADAVESPIGLLPAAGALPVEGLDISDADLAALLAVDVAGWQAELPSMAEHLESFGDRLPRRAARATRRPAHARLRRPTPDRATII